MTLYTIKPTILHCECQLVSFEAFSVRSESVVILLSWHRVLCWSRQNFAVSSYLFIGENIKVRKNTHVSYLNRVWQTKVIIMLNCISLRVYRYFCSGIMAECKSCDVTETGLLCKAYRAAAVHPGFGAQVHQWAAQAKCLQTGPSGCFPCSSGVYSAVLARLQEPFFPLGEILKEIRSWRGTAEYVRLLLTKPPGDALEHTTVSIINQMGISFLY